MKFSYLVALLALPLLANAYDRRELLKSSCGDFEALSKNQTLVKKIERWITFNFLGKPINRDLFKPFPGGYSIDKKIISKEFEEALLVNSIFFVTKKAEDESIISLVFGVNRGVGFVVSKKPIKKSLINIDEKGFTVNTYKILGENIAVQCTIW